MRHPSMIHTTHYQMVHLPTSPLRFRPCFTAMQPLPTSHINERVATHLLAATPKRACSTGAGRQVHQPCQRAPMPAADHLYNGSSVLPDIYILVMRLPLVHMHPALISHPHTQQSRSIPFAKRPPSRQTARQLQGKQHMPPPATASFQPVLLCPPPQLS